MHRYFVIVFLETFYVVLLAGSQVEVNCREKHVSVAVLRWKFSVFQYLDYQQYEGFGALAGSEIVG